MTSQLKTGQLGGNKFIVMCPGLCTLCPLHTLGSHSQLDARSLTLDVYLRPSEPQESVPQPLS